MKKPDILKKSMKKLLLVSLLLLLLPCFTFGAGPPIATSKVKATQPIADSKIKASKIGVKSIKQTPKSLNQKMAPKGLNQTMALKAAMKITAITFKTSTSGDWTFLYDYKNTGFATFAPHQLKFKSTQILKNGMRTPIHTVTYNVANTPGTKSGAHSPWYRCSNASKLMMEIIYKGKVLDKKTVNIPPINVKITNLSSLNGKFKASLKNNTGYTAKVTVRTMSTSPLQGGGSMYRPGAETMVIVPASSSKTCTGVIGDKGQNIGLEVLFKDEKKCSGKGYIVLDSKTLPAATGSVHDMSPKFKVKALAGKVKKDMPVGLQNGPLTLPFRITDAYLSYTGNGSYHFLFNTSEIVNLNSLVPSDLRVTVYYFKAGLQQYWQEVSGHWITKTGDKLKWVTDFNRTETFETLDSYYKFSFRIQPGHFLSEDGEMLDGDGNGQPGGYYNHVFYYGSGQHP